MKKKAGVFSIMMSLVMILAGCVSNGDSNIDAVKPPFSDHLFTRPNDLPSPQHIFSLTLAQRRWLDKTLVPTRHNTLTKQLVDKVLKRDYGLFDYDNSFTRTASQTLSMGQGNCLSMVIMTAAIAKYLSIEFKIHDVKTAPVWDRDGGLYLINGHVNISLKNTPFSRSPTSYVFLGTGYVTLDFIVNVTRRNLSTIQINEQQLGARYFVNLAADAMVKQRWDLAYWLLRQSIEQHSTYAPAWNSLAVVYRRNNLEELAEQTYKYAMSLDKNNINVVANYALLLEQQGRYDELFEVERRLGLFELNNPYRYFDQADLAFAQQNFKQALSLYKKAIKLSPFVDAFHFGLFRTYMALGLESKAIKSLKLASERSADYSDRARYNAKLAMLE